MGIPYDKSDFKFQAKNIGSVWGHGLIWSNTAIFTSLILSCMFLPSLFAKILTVKWTITLGMFSYTLFICTQIHPGFYTVVPGGILFGFGTAILWISNYIYLTKVSKMINIFISLDIF